MKAAGLVPCEWYLKSREERKVHMTSKHRTAIVKIPKASYNKGRWGV